MDMTTLFCPIVYLFFCCCCFLFCFFYFFFFEIYIFKYYIKLYKVSFPFEIFHYYLFNFIIVFVMHFNFEKQFLNSNCSQFGCKNCKKINIYHLQLFIFFSVNLYHEVVKKLLVAMIIAY